MGYEIDFLPVGESNGDAICIRYGSEETGFKIHVVDGGYVETGQTIIDHINAYYGAPRYIDYVVLSHADADHANGLIKVMEHFDVGVLYMNRPWIYAAEIIDQFHGNFTVQGLIDEIREAYESLADLEALAVAKGTLIQEAFAGTQIGGFTVLAPSRARYLNLIPEFDRTPTSYAEAGKGGLEMLFEAVRKAMARWHETWMDEKLDENPPAVTDSNESSLVQFGIIAGRKILLTADAGPQALNEAADVAEYLGIKSELDIVQVPHHGSRRNVTPSVLNRWLGYPVPEGTIRGTAFCSVGSNKPEYPRKRVQNAFLRRGYGVISTRDAWKSMYHGLEPKPGSVAVYPEPFVPEYEE